MSIKFPFVKQLNTYDCGSACVSMLIKKYYKADVSLTDIETLIKNDFDGSSFINIKNGLEKIGINSKVFSCLKSEESIREINFPVLTQIEKDNGYHYVVLYALKSKKIKIGDPSKGIISIELSKFVEIWNPYILSVIEINKERQEKFIQENNSIIRITCYKIINFVAHYKLKILICWLLSLISYFLGVFFSKMFSVYFDVLIPGKLTESISIFSAIFIVCVLFRGLLDYYFKIISLKFDFSVDIRLTNFLRKNFHSKSFECLDKFATGEIITRFNSIGRIRAKIMYLILHLPIDIIIIIYTFILLFRINYMLAGLILIPILLFILMVCLFHKTMQHHGTDLFEKEEEYNTSLFQLISNVETIKNYNVVEIFESKNIEKHGNLINASLKFTSFDLFSINIKNILISVFNILIFSIGTYNVINGNIKNGVLLMFNSLSMYIFDPFTRISALQSLIEEGKVSQEKYENFINIKNTKDVKTKMVGQIDSILYNNISFSFGDKLILKDVSFKAHSGSSISIIGESGSGKTTFAKLLTNYYNPIKGQILINNNPINSYNNLSDKILYVKQRVDIFSDSILNNILLGRKEPIQKIEKIASLIGFDKVISSLPFGLNTLIGENGIQLSLGQFQMLNIIRSTITDYEVIIFDEITSNLDFNLKSKVIDYLLNYGNIKIFITHDMQFAAKTNHVYVINEGALSANTDLSFSNYAKQLNFDKQLTKSIRKI